jgi:hypothetical protein
VFDKAAGRVVFVGQHRSGSRQATMICGAIRVTALIRGILEVRSSGLDPPERLLVAVARCRTAKPVRGDESVGTGRMIFD